MTNPPKSNLDRAIEEAQAKNDSNWYNMTSSIIIILFIAFVIGIFVWAIGAAGDEYNRRKIDPNYGFLYTQNLQSGVLLGCAVAHNKDIVSNPGSITGNIYDVDEVYNDMSKCLTEAGYEFYIRTAGYNNASAADILTLTIFRKCTQGYIDSQWYTPNNKIVETMRCMIESELGFRKKA